MAGKIKEMIDLIIEKRSKDDPLLVGIARAKMILKGINPDNYDCNSEDDPVLIEILKELAKDINMTKFKDAG